MAANTNVANSQADSGASLHVRRVIAYVVLALISVLCLFWFYILFINATRSNSQLSLGFTALPGNYGKLNLQHVLEDNKLPLVSGMFNSVFIATCTAALATYFSTMTAYAIHAYDFKAKKFMFTFILAVMMIPTQVTALGFIKLIKNMGLDNNAIPLIIPAIASPAVFFYMKQYMDSTLPLSLIEAARIDGSGEFRTFNQIVVPLMKPAIAVQAIFGFVASWNNYFTPALVLHDLDKQTLPILLAVLRNADFLKFDMGKVYMFIALSILPVIVIYLILSRYIVGGVTLGGVKG